MRSAAGCTLVVLLALGLPAGRNPVLALAAHLPDCAALTPGFSARVNFDVIMHCLTSGDRLVGLEPGLYPLPGGLTLPPGSRLRGNNATDRPRLQIATPSSRSSFVISTGSNTSVSFLILDGANNLAGGCCTSIVRVGGRGSLVHDVEAMNTALGPAVYFLGASSSDNHFLRVHLHHCHSGVIFAPGLDVRHSNIFEAGTIENVACDAITFAGYGKALGNLIRHNGFDCADGSPPTPGGGFYCSGNVDGGVIVDNEIHDNCGMSLDFDTCANFNVSRNRLYNPGNTFAGLYPHCAGAITFHLLDSQDFHIEGNSILNERGSNMQSMSYWKDLHRVFGNSDAHVSTFSDLPGQENTVLGFVVSHRPRRGAKPSLGHEIRWNTFRATCTGVAHSCVGVAYYAGRGTGLDPESFLLPPQASGVFVSGYVPSRTMWRPSRYIGNWVAGSDQGSRRCGKNWYAGDSPSCLEGAPPPCNEDDHKHNKAIFRNDPDCSQYSVEVGTPATHGEAGHLRVPLPLRPPPPAVSHRAGPQFFAPSPTPLRPPTSPEAPYSFS